MAALRVVNKLFLHVLCTVSVVTFLTLAYIVFLFALRRPYPFLNLGFYLQIAGFLLIGWAGVDIFRDAYKKLSH